MPKMTDSQLLAIVDAAEQDAMIYNGEYTEQNEKYLKEYLGEPYGDELPDQSSVVSTDIADVVESDMPSLARVFIGSGDIAVFHANTENEADIEEAAEKTKYINWLVRSQPDSFKIIHDWLKDAEIQKNGVVKYFIEELKSVEVVKYEDIDQSELSEIVDSLRGAEVDRVKVEVDEQEEPTEGRFNISFRVTREEKKVRIVNVPPEDFLLSKGAACIDTAPLVGDRIRKTRGELVADGFPRDLIEQLPSTGDNEARKTTINDIRHKDSGGDQDSEIRDWAGEFVEIRDLYVMVDYDGDGIAERRHILKSGDHILVNESFAHVPYASLSAVLMPHRAIGRSRAEIVSPTQRQKTVLMRGMLNNIYMVNNPRNVVHPDVDLDDMLTVRTNGIVRMDDDTSILPQNAVFPLQVPYIGDRTLQVLQYVDQARAQTTGAMLPNQGLDADAIAKETATRFEGVADAGAAKLELIARNYAETGFRKLYEGLAWLVSRFQDSETEIRVLGKQLSVNPSKWKRTHYVTTSVGLGAGDNEKLVGALQGIYGIQQQLKAQGSALVDESDIYATLKRIVDGLGLPAVNEFFNNPEEPDELLKAENEILNNVVLQLQEQVQSMANPLAEAEQIKAQARLIEAQGKQSTEVAKALEDQRQFNAQLAADLQKSQNDLAAKLTELELKYSQNVPGAVV